ncbi:MAG: hypothetical protein QG577_1702, partial [Thermodesulfobacteriota bacterium]|nr:hypothetical protein [Thermodesulfobacteriota bacterium]
MRTWIKALSIYDKHSSFSDSFGYEKECAHKTQNDA